MLKCKLSELMGKHKMNIQDVHERTGLNRNTISNLYHERVTRIDFDTIEKLCKLFECRVSDLLEII
jgi:putative transcriptional regulator